MTILPIILKKYNWLQPLSNFQINAKVKIQKNRD